MPKMHVWVGSAPDNAGELTGGILGGILLRGGEGTEEAEGRESERERKVGKGVREGKEAYWYFFFPHFNRVPTPPGKSWIFLFKIPGPGKSWKITLVLESPEN